MINEAPGSYAAIFLIVLAEQLGLPIPSMPILVAAGAMAGTGRIGPVQVVLVVMAAALAGDLFWYELGRRRGRPVLKLLCHLSLEPDSCVRRTQDYFSRRGDWSIVIAKFVPGLNTLAPPLAGVIRMPIRRFLFLDLIGILLWSAGFVGLGFAFSEQLERVADYAEQMGRLFPLLLVVGLASYVAGKYVQRRRFLAGLKAARISPEELMAKLDAGEQVTIVDLRHHLDQEQDLEVIPGALRIHVGEDGQLDHRAAELPLDREIVLYCA